MTGGPSVLLRAVGDIALGDHPLCVGFGTHSRGVTERPEFPFRRIQPWLSGGDVLFGNLECTLSERGLRAGDYHSVQMRGHAAYVAGLKAAGFDVLNHANNHSMQHGAQPFLDTVRLLEEAGIQVCGVAASTHRAAEPAIVRRNGLTLAFLGYSLRPRQYFSREPLYAEGHAENILEDLAKARRTADAVVVSLHWGDEFIDRPSPEEVDLAHDIMDAGAHLVIGHHPHVLRGVERYGRGYIAYSLGNFVCDMLWDQRLRETAVLECRISAQGVADLKLIPTWIGEDYGPEPLYGERAAALSRRLVALSAALAGRGAERGHAQETDDYRRAAVLALTGERRKAHRYFARNAYRFPPRILFQQLATWARNRLAERGISGGVSQPPTI